MTRIRTVKPALFKHEALFDAELETGLPLRVAFIGLFCCCDREGRFKWHPRTLKSDVLPFDDIDFSRVLDALTTRGYVVKYACNGEEFGVIPTFCKHQMVNNRETPSELPPPPEAPPDVDLTRAARVPDAPCACSSGKDIGKGIKERNKDTARSARAESPPRFDARRHLLSHGVAEKIADDWLTLRRTRRASVTETAIAGIEREAAKACLPLNDALQICCERGWSGFRASWLDRERQSGPGPPHGNGARNGAGLWALDSPALDALARELGISEARPGESMQTFIGRIQAAQNRLH